MPQPGGIETISDLSSPDSRRQTIKERLEGLRTNSQVALEEGLAREAERAQRAQETIARIIASEPNIEDLT